MTFIIMRCFSLNCRHDLHAFMDEVYALSVWAEHNRFRSVLSLSDIPDPQKTHFVWSFSKVFMEQIFEKL